MVILVLILLVMSGLCSTILIAACILGARADRTVPTAPPRSADSQEPNLDTNVLTQDMETMLVAEQGTINRQRHTGPTESIEENTFATRLA